MINLNERMKLLKEKLMNENLSSEIIRRFGSDEPFLLIEIANEEDEIKNFCKEIAVFEDEFNTVCCCEGCLKEYHSEEYINSCINNPKKWISMYSQKEMSNLGWIPVNEKEYEYGMYEVNDDPFKILKRHQKEDKDYVFVRTDENPFMQRFILMTKDKEES